MLLSGSQQLLLAVSLALCACFLLPRMFGGGVRDTGKQDPRRIPPPRGSQGNPHSSRSVSENTNNLGQIKSQMEKQLKTEKTGTGHSMAFTLMPIYAIGVAVFAAYKFSKSNEKNKSEPTKEETTKKAKQTDNQLLELERHLSHTEKMLNSLLTQLDPLSNCVNSLAADQKDEIMNQLQSIRQLMKKSGMDKSAFSNSGNESCEDTLEDLIDSFNVQNTGISEKEDAVSKLDLDNHDLRASEDPEVSDCNEDSSRLDEQDMTPRHTAEGLRKRNIKD